jgi:hypothetical protein
LVAAVPFLLRYREQREHPALVVPFGALEDPTVAGLDKLTRIVGERVASSRAPALR